MPKSETSLKELLYDIRRIEQHREKLSENKIRAIYRTLMKDLNAFLADEYIKYSDKDGRFYFSYLDAQNKRAKFLEEIVEHIDNISPSLKKEMLSLIDDTYQKSYDGMINAFKNADMPEKFKTASEAIDVNPDVIKQAVNNNISKLTLPTVMEKHRQEIIYQIQQTLNIGLMNGDRYETLAKKISERVDVSYNKAINIVRTETHRVQESGLIDCAKDIANALDGSGMIYTATWRTMMDSRVRPNQRRHTKSGWRTYKSGKADHTKMEGVTIKVGDKFKLEPNVYADCPGMSGVARHDCRCRCYLDYDLMTEEEFNSLENKQVNNLNSKTTVKFIDKNSKSDIINMKRDGMGLSIEIDEFTPCLIDKKSGQIVDTKYSIANKLELKGLKKQGWNFNWLDDDLKNSTVYKLTLCNDDTIQGLVALTDYPRDSALYINIAESAPHNIGKDKKYEGVGGHLFAIAAKESFDKGYGGFLFLDAKNTELVNYYHDKFGAILLGMPHPYRMFIDEEKAQELLKIYTLKGD